MSEVEGRGRDERDLSVFGPVLPVPVPHGEIIAWALEDSLGTGRTEASTIAMGQVFRAARRNSDPLDPGSGATMGIKVYVMLTTCNEKGLNAVSVTRYDRLRPPP